MKNTQKRNVLTILGYIVILLISSNYYLTISFDSFFLENAKFDIYSLTTNDYWNLMGTPISIDDTISNKNWSYTADNYDWCSGSGTWNDPYIIENVTINGQNTNTCIEIKNSNAYFIIRNCTLYNSSSDYQHAAIKLDHVNNGKVINNTCLYNYYSGIFLLSSDNNSILENNAHYNEKGIHSFFSDNNTISGNIANNNEIAISIYFSDIHYVRGNIANNCATGIYLHAANANTLLDNVLNNHKIAISFNGDNYDNYASGNLMDLCSIDIAGDLIEEYSTNTIDSTNLVNNKPVYDYINVEALTPDEFINAGQVILINCSHSIISGVNTSLGTLGISLFFSDYNEISNNFASNNSDYGIYLHESNNNYIFNNTANNNTNRGIVLGNSNHSIIKENIANGNGYFGITLAYSQNNTLMQNTGNYNQDSGIEIYYSNNNTINDNMVTRNNNGIYLSGSSNNLITENTANYNSGHGICMFGCDFNYISGNIANINSYGVYLYSSDNNTITFNTLYRNSIDCIRELDCIGNIIEHNQCAPVEIIPNIPGYTLYVLLLSLMGLIFPIIVKTRKIIEFQ
ncbi:MAG: hypothetical protein EU531_01980 [Promethearchaeota archaeon]|nr:MAG: hypothetical protein EU531_01980 [Candidatus Lokiarchaeota archaeon]